MTNEDNKAANPEPENTETQDLPDKNDAPEDQDAEMRDDALEDRWPLEADRVAGHMSLIDLLRLVAGYYGRRSSVASLTAGLPISKNGLTPTLFMRAAERASLNARLAERTLEALALVPNLPCVLVLEKTSPVFYGKSYIQKNTRPKKNRDRK